MPFSLLGVQAFGVFGNWLRELGAQEFRFLISLACPSSGRLGDPPCDFSLFWEIDGSGLDLRCAAEVLNFPCLTGDADKAASSEKMAPGSSPDCRPRSPWHL